MFTSRAAASPVADVRVEASACLRALLEAALDAAGAVTVLRPMLTYALCAALYAPLGEAARGGALAESLASLRVPATFEGGSASAAEDDSIAYGRGPTKPSPEGWESAAGATVQALESAEARLRELARARRLARTRARTWRRWWTWNARWRPRWRGRPPRTARRFDRSRRGSRRDNTGWKPRKPPPQPPASPCRRSPPRTPRRRAPRRRRRRRRNQTSRRRPPRRRRRRRACGATRTRVRSGTRARRSATTAFSFPSPPSPPRRPRDAAWRKSPRRKCSRISPRRFDCSSRAVTSRRRFARRRWRFPRGNEDAPLGI